MTHDDAFLQAIIENPDDGPRLVYADWLDEHRDPDRAEFIRVQCELARMAVFNDRRRGLQARQQHLLATQGTKWLTQDWPDAGNPAVHARTFDRGFVAELSLRGRGLGDAGVQALVACPRLALLTALDLAGNDIGDPGIRALAGSPFLTRLRFLDLRDNRFQLVLLEPLAASPHLPGLRELALTLEVSYVVTSPDFSGEVVDSGMKVDDVGLRVVQSWFRQHGKDVAIRG
jgi:uncharacterized protein (TIGR02996 family)